MNKPTTLQRIYSIFLCLVLLAGAVLALPAEASAAGVSQGSTNAPATASSNGGSPDAPILISPNPVSSRAAVLISTAQDMYKLAEDPNGYFVLANDINMAELAPPAGAQASEGPNVSATNSSNSSSAANWTPIPFSGILEGAGHTIYNLKIDRFGQEKCPTVDGNAKVYETASAGLFSALDGAQIQDLAIRGADINVKGDVHCFVGALAGWMQNTLVENCTVSDTRISLTAACSPEPGATDNGKPRTSCNAGVGGLAGFGAGNGKGAESPTGNYNQIRNCSVDVTLVFDDQCDPSLKVEQFLGGLLGAGYADITGCTVNIDGYAAIRGYAHNGGLVGMFYVYDGTDTIGLVSGCEVSGTIRFYENNRDRRAYCDPYVGEKMTWPKFADLKSSFRNGETRNYGAKMSPEQCDQPQITDTVVPGSCHSLGWTAHTCSVCGNTWNDSFTPKVHQPGDWSVISYPGANQDGLRVKECKLCGEYVEQEVIKAAQSLTAQPAELKLNYKDTQRLTVTVEPEDAYWPGLIWTTTDENVATVYQNGTVTATGRGECVISCATADGTAYTNVKVTVGYSPLQWIIKIVLFGWIWY